MAVISRRYQPAPPPPPPDEAYWNALLAQAEEADDVSIEEEIDWTEIAEVQPLSMDQPMLSHSHDAEWRQAEEAYHNDLTVHLKVIGFNRGGLLVEWNMLRGFVPASQLVNEDGKPQLMHYIGHLLPLRVIELSQAQNRLILSQRAAQVVPGTRATVLQQLMPNTRIRGLITNICDFGAFVDLGGVEGLIHISELSWGRVEHPSEVLQRGQEIEAFILNIDRDEGRIALSLKRLLPDPWLTVETRYCVGQQVEGLVTSVVDFGAFACLEEGLEGLIHISELAEGHFLHPRNVVQAGQHVRVRILNIDSRARRIGLSLRGIRQSLASTGLS